MIEKIIYNDQARQLEQKKDQMIESLARLMHESWRQKRYNKETNTYNPRFKPIEDKEWIDKHNGISEVDIANTSFDNLPDDWKEENRISAKVAIEKVNDILYLIHDNWLDRNDASASEEQKVQYSKLPKEEKQKDIDVLEEAVRVILENMATKKNLNQDNVETQRKENLNKQVAPISNKTERNGHDVMGLESKRKESEEISKVRGELMVKFEEVKKETKKHPTNEQLLDQIIEVIKEMKSIPKGDKWNQLSIVRNKGFFSKNAFTGPGHFKSFNLAVELAIKRAKEKGIKLYFLEKK